MYMYACIYDIQKWRTAMELIDKVSPGGIWTHNISMYIIIEMTKELIKVDTLCSQAVFAT